MSGGQIVSLILAILLLLPGGCFLFFGAAFSADNGEALGLGAMLLAIAALILGIAGLLFWLAFRRRPPT